MLRWYIEVAILVTASFILGAVLMTLLLVKLLPEASQGGAPRPPEPAAPADEAP